MVMIYDYTITTRKGEQLNLSDYRGKVIMVVNTATGCGFTPQYAPIEQLYKDYHDQGLEILDIPCNQFGGQAPGTDDEIHEFCTLHFNTTFPQMKKAEVNGENELPLYTYLKSQKGFEGFGPHPYKELLEKYDITYMEAEEEKDMAIEMLGLYDDDTMKALFWGLDRQFKSEKELFFYVLIKVLVEADNSLDTTEQAIYFEQTNAESAMLDWTLNNRDHLLCYIIKVVPRCDVFNDEMVRAVGSSDPFIDDLRFKEFVYMPSGFQRKHHFNVGDNVQYIFYDGHIAILRKSSIMQLPSENTSGVLMSDGYMVPERYVFPI